MKKRWIAVAASLLGLAGLPASVSATTTATPTSLTFSQQQVGTTSNPQTVTVTVACNTPDMMGGCLNNETFTPNPSFTGVNIGDFTQTNTCGASVSNIGLGPGFCQFNVRFKPTAPGTRTATLGLGSSTSGGPPPILLSGTAVAAPSNATPSTGSPTGTGPTTTGKKCKKKKKKHSASSAKKKKCKKK